MSAQLDGMPSLSLRVRVMLLMALGILLTLGSYSPLGWCSVRTHHHSAPSRGGKIVRHAGLVNYKRMFGWFDALMRDSFA